MTFFPELKKLNINLKKMSSELIPHKKYILQFKNDFNNSIFLAKDSFKFLDSFLDEVTKLNEHEFFNDESLVIFNYIENSNFYVNKYKAQKLLDEMYFDFYFDFFSKKHSCCSRLLEKLEIFFYKLDFLSEINDEKIKEIYKFIIISIKHCIKIFNRSILKSELIFFLKNFFYFIPVMIIDNFCLDILRILDESNIFSSQDNFFLIFCDDCFFIDLYFLSVAPVQIYNNDIFDQKYNCYYNNATLSFIIKKFLNTRNFDYFEYFDTSLKVFFENYFDLNLNSFSFLENENNLIYSIVRTIYIDKIILNDFIFNSIIISCFDVYYFSSRKNILYDKSGNFVFRLIT